MRTNTLTAPTVAEFAGVNKLLKSGKNYLTSKFFSNFVLGFSFLAEFAGILLDDDRLILVGGMVFVFGLAPLAVLRTVRGIRKSRLGIEDDMF